MALFINTNVLSLVAQHSLGRTQSSMDRTVERLSTGLRINRASDDTVGLAISERLTAQIRGITIAVRNANDAISALQTADGSLQEFTNLLQRARELAVQAASDSNNVLDRSSLADEVNQILSELDRLANTVSFNGKKLLDGTFKDQLFHIGANASESIQFSIDSARTQDVGATVREGAAVSSTVFADLGTITLNGVSIDVSGNSDIQSVIDALNAQKNDTGVTASKNIETAVVDTAFNALTSGQSGTLKINDVAITLNTANADTAANFVARVNEFSDQTGVVASTNSVGVVFTHKNGGDIKFEETSGTFGVGDAVANSDARTFNAGITLQVELGGSLSVASSTTSLDLGLSSAVTSVSVSNSDKRVNNINVSTATGANDAIRTIDFALDQINRVRSSIGAVQNRLTSTINSLQITSENLSAARSRVRDADIAQETAELTRNQILIQAGIAVLAQASQLPSVALSLLGG